jgi:hypothetical protein
MTMPTQLSFVEQYRYVENDAGVTIPVLLGYNEKVIRVTAKVDTGADVCLFAREHGERLGLAIDEGLPITLSSLGGPVDAYGHEIAIQTLGITFQSWIYFYKFPGQERNLLGRRGWLRNLKLAVIDYDSLIYLSPYSDE